MGFGGKRVESGVCGVVARGAEVIFIKTEKVATRLQSDPPAINGANLWWGALEISWPSLGQWKIAANHTKDRIASFSVIKMQKSGGNCPYGVNYVCKMKLQILWFTQQFARPFQRLSSKIMVSRANELHNTKALGAFRTRKYVERDDLHATGANWSVSRRI